LDEASCGEKLLLENTDKIGYRKQSAERYALEPIIDSFVEFDKFSGKVTLEISVGLWTDHQWFAESGALLLGIDLTNRAVEHIRTRLSYFGLESYLCVGGAENIDFRDNTFDLVYSLGVIHHSPNTPEVVYEIFRFLKLGAS
jgi:ubiquinone/menaquinone biosynthesis C-methylase UbiE